MKYLLLSFFLYFSLFAFSQERVGTINNHSSIEECKDWFKENILLLDPIEGVYSVRVSMQRSNTYTTNSLREFNDTFIIYKRIDGDIVIQNSIFSGINICCDAYGIRLESRDN